MVHVEYFSNYIVNLREVIYANKVTLLLHQNIIEEWNRHKIEWRNNWIKKVQKIRTSANEVNRKENIHILNNTLHIDQQIASIEGFFEVGTLVDTPDSIKMETHERLKSGIAPFHNKANSVNDWEIFASTAHYCSINGISSLYFISSNTDEFDGDNGELHQDLSSRFPKIIVQYFTYISQFLEYITDEIQREFEKTKYIRHVGFNWNSTTGFDAIESIYNLYTNRFKGLNFIPIFILRKCFPFADSQNSNVYFSNFKLIGISNDILEYFMNLRVLPSNQIHIGNQKSIQGVENYKEKAEYVFKKLTRNLIFEMLDENHSKQYASFLYDADSNSAVGSLFDSFDFLGLLVKLHNCNENDFTLELGYLNYQICNYNSAIRIYENLINETPQNDDLTILIAKHNLYHLSYLMCNAFNVKKIDYLKIEELRKIDLDLMLINIKNTHNYELHKYIINHEFFHDAFYSITTISSDIITQYQKSIFGGYSSNRRLNDLICEYAKYDACLNQNYVIYDKYLNNTKLFDRILEGLLACYALPEHHTNRLESLDNFWVQKIIQNASKDSLIHYLKKYNISLIKFYSDDPYNTNLNTLIENLFKSPELYKEAIAKHIEDNNSGFWDYILGLMENSFIVLGVLELVKKDTVAFAEKFILFFSLYEWSNPLVISSLSFYFKSKNKVLGYTWMYKFLMLVINKHSNLGESVLYDVLECFEDESIRFQNEEDRILTREIIFNKCSKCKGGHTEELFKWFYLKLNDPLKDEICNHFITLWECNKDFESYSNLIFFNITNPDEKIIFEFIDQIEIESYSNSHYGWITNNRNYLVPSIDRVLNICFAGNINLESNKLDKIRNFNDYYKWLLNMDKFDYDNFKLNWLDAYQFSNYYKVMSKSERLIDFLKSYLTKLNNPIVERTLLKIAIFKNNWE